ncbi:DUF3408 domain-containing protein [Porphyromonas circumdentaria]|uniref:Senescence regulator n=1 Tax=Porphyromonas circumdentaria TaxID=29524 RepID=A0A1T4Q5L5_9PORP|nr:DUF3408 domain-containing protein [Porphyromonas circumdentaria]MBB6276641.1 hypothetical protein [Porphyromonas circumdentaria]SJZ99063.1 Senescence regulator [Porphyromonas circumdentaria]
MKEGFDLSHYLNVGKETQEKQSQQSQASEPAKLSSTSEQTLPSESLNEEKDKLKAEQSEQEKPQAIPSIQRRISHKQRKESLDSYRETFLVPHKIIDRKATYLSCSTWERLEFIVRRLGDYGANVSSFLECIALQHLEEYGDDIEHWRKL